MKKKIITILLFLAVLCGFSSIAQAATASLSDLESQIRALQAQIAGLQTKKPSRGLIIGPMSGPLTQNPAKITSVTSPASLKVGQSGTWIVGAKKLPDGIVDFLVNWGDKPATRVVHATTMENGKQVIHFRNTYSAPGTYTQTFTISIPGLSSVATSTKIKVTR